MNLKGNEFSVNLNKNNVSLGSKYNFFSPHYSKKLWKYFKNNIALWLKNTSSEVRKTKVTKGIFNSSKLCLFISESIITLYDIVLLL